MAHHKSAKKRIRRNARANVANSQYLSTVRTAVKKFRTAITTAAEGQLDKAAVRPLFETAQSLLSKAAAKGIVHRNNAARKIGRMAAALKLVEDGTAPAAASKAKPAKKAPAKKAAKPAAAAAPKTTKKTAAKKSAE